MGYITRYAIGLELQANLFRPFRWFGYNANRSTSYHGLLAGKFGNMKDFGKRFFWDGQMFFVYGAFMDGKEVYNGSFPN